MAFLTKEFGPRTKISFKSPYLNSYPYNFSITFQNLFGHIKINNPVIENFMTENLFKNDYVNEWDAKKNTLQTFEHPKKECLLNLDNITLIYKMGGINSKHSSFT